MKTCRNCGASNSADDRFCGNCGASLPQDDDQQAAAQSDPSNPIQPENRPPDPYAQVPAANQPQQPVWGGPASGQPQQDRYGQGQPGGYGQPPQDPYGQQAGQYGQPPRGQDDQHQGQYGQQRDQYGPQQGAYGQQPTGNPYGDAQQPWYSTGPAGPGAPPPPVRRGRAGWKTALLIIVGLILLICVGSIIFAVTPYGSDQIERLGTWAAEESTQQAGGE